MSEEPPYSFRRTQSTMPAYGECEYWDERYTREPAAFDWYQGYSGLQAILLHVFPQDANLLQVGVGSSRLQEDMVRAGWRRIVNIDYSQVVIKHMAALHQAMPELEYRVADARHMPEFPDACFEGVLDKGTLDATLCGERSVPHATAMVAECFRVLKPGHPFVLITYGDPSSRLPYLGGEGLDWEVVVYALTKQEMVEALDAEPVVRPLIKGPYPAHNVDCMDALSGLEGMHFVYVCRRRGGGGAGAAARAGSEELQAGAAQAEARADAELVRAGQPLSPGVPAAAGDDGDTGASTDPELPEARPEEAEAGGAMEVEGEGGRQPGSATEGQ
ncbi:hypothetical protein HYH03_004633 [Edaphochlamys debaryana]|uniref:Methyltransferase type 11 domain-containing protein n=1 Tax=Edaphochlamys debaryana TaxID=47281 RepID=A0A835YEU2_9CHLO|nr:hypothetical protein HYH03_004633 [Edaphochlamys debaryana]|eukprot:KAG2497480.1 hypothetical protein HYH03_004633 [Edaphochlamys debaryana]